MTNMTAGSRSACCQLVSLYLSPQRHFRWHVHFFSTPVNSWTHISANVLVANSLLYVHHIVKAKTQPKVHDARMLRFSTTSDRIVKTQHLHPPVLDLWPYCSYVFVYFFKKIQIMCSSVLTNAPRKQPMFWLWKSLPMHQHPLAEVVCWKKWDT